jgi:hypothetical protein
VLYDPLKGSATITLKAVLRSPKSSATITKKQCYNHQKAVL